MKLLKKGGDTMETIQAGTEEITKMASLSCCWPPGTMSSQYGEDE